MHGPTAPAWEKAPRDRLPHKGPGTKNSAPHHFDAGRSFFC